MFQLLNIFTMLPAELVLDAGLAADDEKVTEFLKQFTSKDLAVVENEALRSLLKVVQRGVMLKQQDLENWRSLNETQSRKLAHYETMMKQYDAEGFIDFDTFMRRFEDDQEIERQRYQKLVRELQDMETRVGKERSAVHDLRRALDEQRVVVGGLEYQLEKAKKELQDARVQGTLPRPQPAPQSPVPQEARPAHNAELKQAQQEVKILRDQVRELKSGFEATLTQLETSVKAEQQLRFRLSDIDTKLRQASSERDRLLLNFDQSISTDGKSTKFHTRVPTTRSMMSKTNAHDDSTVRFLTRQLDERDEQIKKFEQECAMMKQHVDQVVEEYECLKRQLITSTPHQQAAIKVSTGNLLRATLERRPASAVSEIYQSDAAALRRQLEIRDRDIEEKTMELNELHKRLAELEELQPKSQRRTKSEIKQQTETSAVIERLKVELEKLKQNIGEFHSEVSQTRDFIVNGILNDTSRSLPPVTDLALRDILLSFCALSKGHQPKDPDVQKQLQEILSVLSRAQTYSKYVGSHEHLNGQIQSLQSLLALKDAQVQKLMVLLKKKIGQPRQTPIAVPMPAIPDPPVLVETRTLEYKYKKEMDAMKDRERAYRNAQNEMKKHVQSLQLQLAKER